MLPAHSVNPVLRGMLHVQTLGLAPLQLLLLRLLERHVSIQP
jgi:hypothetical protein